MSLLEILEFPDPSAEKKSRACRARSTHALKQTIADMFETMYAASGIGLAATQVNIQKTLARDRPSRRRGGGAQSPRVY